jgi:hypothetical protein
MVVHKAPEAFGYADKTAYACILCYANYAVTGSRHRHSSAHFHAVAALVTDFNVIMGSILYHPDSAFCFVFFFKVGL